MISRFFLVAFFLLMINEAGFSMLKAGNGAVSSKSTSMTLKMGHDEVNFVLPPFSEIFDAYIKSTPATIKAVIEKYSPSKILFEAYHKLKYQKAKKEELENLFDCAVFSYFLIRKMIEMNDEDTCRLFDSRFLNILDVFRQKKCVLSKKDKKRFLENIANPKKLSMLHENDVLVLYTKEIQEKIKSLSVKIQRNLSQFCNIQGLNSVETLTELVEISSSKQLRDLVCLFGCRKAFVQVTKEFGAFTRAVSSDVPANKAENVRYNSLLVYGESVSFRVNMAMNLMKNNQLVEAERWAIIVSQEGSSHALTNLEVYKNNPDAEVIFLSDNKEYAINAHMLEVNVLYNRAAAILKANNYKMTDEVLQMLISCADQGFKTAIKNLPKFLIIEQRYKEAYKYGIKAAAEHGYNEAYMEAADAAVALGRYDDAYAALQKYTGQKMHDYYYLMAACHYAFGNFQEAQKYNNYISEDEPKALVQRLNILINFDDLSGATKVFEQIKNKYNNDGNYYLFALLAMATYLKERGDSDEAMAYLKKSIEIKDTQIAQYNIGLYFYFKFDFEKAQEHFLKAELMDFSKVLGEHKCQHLIKFYLGRLHIRKGQPDEAIKCMLQAYKQGMREAALWLASLFGAVNDLRAEKYYKLAVAHHIEHAELFYGLFLDQQKREQEAQLLLEQSAGEESGDDDDNGYDSIHAVDLEKENGSIHAVDLEKKNDAKICDSFQEQPRFVEAKDTKKYKWLLEVAQRKAEALKQKGETTPKNVEDRSYDDLDITLFSAGLQIEIDQHELRIKSLLSALANKIKAGKFEKLKGYTKRFSMRISQSDRLVFDVVEGGIDAPTGIKAIVIVSAHGHYEQMTQIEHDAPTGIDVTWSDEEDIVE